VPSSFEKRTKSSTCRQVKDAIIEIRQFHQEPTNSGSLYAYLVMMTDCLVMLLPFAAITALRHDDKTLRL
jgi:hypothetical protein